MRLIRLYFRPILLIWACVLAFGIGVEMPRAAQLDDTCGSVCNTQCEDHDGCATYIPMGCSCRYLCEDGHDGEYICT